MPEAAVIDATSAPNSTTSEPSTVDSPGWRTTLPSEFRDNEVFKPYKSMSEFAKSHIETVTKASELEKKLEQSIPRLPKDASEEDRNLYFEALGRPKTPGEYKLTGENESAPEWTNLWKNNFHKRALTQEQADGLNQDFVNAARDLQKVQIANVKAEHSANVQRLKSAMGEKYDTSVEAAKRVVKDVLGTNYDHAFSMLIPEVREGITQLIVELSSRTTEDRSPQGGNSLPSGKQVSFIAYDKSPAPPKKG